MSIRPMCWGVGSFVSTELIPYLRVTGIHNTPEDIYGLSRKHHTIGALCKFNNCPCGIHVSVILCLVRGRLEINCRRARNAH